MLTRPAQAKLNLGLRVFPPRADGFHDIETWMVAISWYDTLRVEPGGPLRLVVTGRADGVPAELEKNLVGRGALKLAAAAGIEPTGQMTLHKVLPPGGGIGGGSSDAAAALVLLNELWGLRWEDTRLEQIAATLGSDIPFFVRQRPSLCTGRGEIMSPLPLSRPLTAVLILPAFGCPTKDIYQAFDAGHRHEPPKPPTQWKICAAATAEQLSSMLVNDLEPAAFHVAPLLSALQKRAEQIGGKRVHLTGSGSTLFVLCGSGSEAQRLQQKLEGELGEACVAAEILR